MMKSMKSPSDPLQDPLFDPDPLFCLEVDIKEERDDAPQIMKLPRITEETSTLKRKLKQEKFSFEQNVSFEDSDGEDCSDSERDSDDNDDDDFEVKEKKPRLLMSTQAVAPKIGTGKFDPSLVKRNSSTQALIELYKSQRCLWDKSDADYNDYESREESYRYIIDEIQGKFDVTIDFVYLEGLITKIRKQYCAVRLALNEENPEKLSQCIMDHYKKCDFLGDIEEEELDDETKNELKGIKNKRKFNPTFYRRNPRTAKFIELYENQPSLWDKSNVEYKNPESCAKAYTFMINEIQRIFNVTLSRTELESLIRKIRKQYCDVRSIVEQKSSEKLADCALDHYKKCKFLGDIEEEVDNECKNELKDVKNKNKFLIFAHFKSHTEAFINIYQRFPMLYDPNNPDYGSNMKRRDYYNTMADLLRKEVNICITPEKLYDYVVSLRRWYNYACGRLKKDKKLTEEEQKYYEMLKFLPAQQKCRRKFNCEVCGCLLLSETSLKGHMFEAHQIGEMPLKCPVCAHGFKKKSQLHYHIERFHQAKIYQCEFCEWKFSVTADYRNHLKTHSNEKPHVCELCGKAFRKHCQLNDHVNAVHTKLRPFKCTMCSKQFLKQSLLNTHMKSHLNIRDKICETCGKGFTNCHALIRHRQIHSEVKKFACTMCDARYSQFSPLNRHMKRTHKVVRNNKTGIVIE